MQTILEAWMKQCIGDILELHTYLLPPSPPCGLPASQAHGQGPWQLPLPLQCEDSMKALGLLALASVWELPEHRDTHGVLWKVLAVGMDQVFILDSASEGERKE